MGQQSSQLKVATIQPGTSVSKLVSTPGHIPVQTIHSIAKTVGEDVMHLCLMQDGTHSYIPESQLVVTTGVIKK